LTDAAACSESFIRFRHHLSISLLIYTTILSRLSQAPVIRMTMTYGNNLTMYGIEAEPTQFSGIKPQIHLAAMKADR